MLFNIVFHFQAKNASNDNGKLNFMLMSSVYTMPSVKEKFFIKFTSKDFQDFPISRKVKMKSFYGIIKLNGTRGRFLRVKCLMEI